MAKVSIIIPTYNVEAYLNECMDSVTGQTLKDIEIICINDGSTDNSLDILKSYAQNDKRIVIVDKKNEGYGVGMNIGLDRATGEYIGIVEPDDFIPLNMYEDLYNKAKEENLDFVKADFYRFKRDATNGNMTLRYIHLSKDPEDYNKVFDPSQKPEAIRYIMETWSGIYRRTFLAGHHIRYNTTPGASFQDNGFFFQTFVFAKRAMILNKPYYMNRRDNPNSSVYDKGKVYAMDIEYDYIREILLEHPDIWKRFNPIYWVKRYHTSRFTLVRISDAYKREYVYSMSKVFKRADQLGELTQSLFGPNEWIGLQTLIKDPDRYYYTKVLGDASSRASAAASAKNKRLKQKLADIESGWSFKIGRIITYIPRKILGKG